ncbi:cupin domain-containing protein, partial [Pseudonocardia halophobica]|uniref:cupin domain-containing protein n=1 Tax=Pseudonocardia halophobica TaxID=29401 RepID=UPI0022F2AA2C
IGGVTDDEVFVVLEGRAEVTFDDTKETIQIGPGDVVRLNKGQRNVWRTIERLRKVSIWTASGS